MKTALSPWRRKKYAQELKLRASRQHQGSGRHPPSIQQKNRQNTSSRPQRDVRISISSSSNDNDKNDDSFSTGGANNCNFFEAVHVVVTSCAANDGEEEEEANGEGSKEKENRCTNAGAKNHVDATNKTERSNKVLYKETSRRDSSSSGRARRTNTKARTVCPNSETALPSFQLVDDALTRMADVLFESMACGSVDNTCYSWMDSAEGEVRCFWCCLKLALFNIDRGFSLMSGSVTVASVGWSRSNIFVSNNLNSYKEGCSDNLHNWGHQMTYLVDSTISQLVSFHS